MAPRLKSIWSEPMKTKADALLREIAAAAAEGDRDKVSIAKGELLMMHRPVLMDRIRRFLAKVDYRMEAEDLCQDVFVRVLKSFHTFDRNGGSFYGWIKVIADNVCKDFLTDNQILLRQDEIPDEDPTVEEDDYKPSPLDLVALHAWAVATAPKKLPSQSLRHDVHIPGVSPARTVAALRERVRRNRECFVDLDTIEREQEPPKIYPTRFKKGHVPVNKKIKEEEKELVNA